MIEEEDYGTKIDYDPLWSGPMSKQRKSTDIRCLISLGIFCLLWLSIAVYAYLNGNQDDWEDYLRQIGVYRSEKDADADDFYDLYYGIQRDSRSNARFNSIIFLYVALPALLCTAFIVLLRWFAKIVVYLFIALFLVAIVALPCYRAISSNWADKIPYVTRTVISAIVSIFVAMVLIVHHKKVQIACEVIKVASSCVIFFPASFIFPLLPLVAFCAVITFAFTILFGLVSMSIQYGTSPWHIIFHLINLFGLLWLGSFVIGFLRITLSGTFATWYWTRDKINVPFFTLARCMKTTIIYHLGTLAFGSLIIAVCTSIRVLLSLFKKRSGNGYYLCCAQLEFWEGIVKYISRTAYTMNAMHGTDLLRSAKNTFNLFMRNPMKVIVISNVTEVMLIVAQVLIVGVTLLISTFWESNESSIQGAPLILVILTTAFYFKVLSAAIDTIFISILEDFERNDGSNERPYFMNFKLKKLLFQDSQYEP